MESLKYRRILLKLSGEALGNNLGTGIDPKRALSLPTRSKKFEKWVSMSQLSLVLATSGAGARELNWDGSGHSRLYGHVSYCNEWVGINGCP